MTDATESEHERPEKLGKRGGRLWAEVTERWALRPDEREMLEDACRELDLADRLETELRSSPLIVKGGYDQPVPSPLVTEVRQHRSTAARLLLGLKLPDEPGQAELSVSEKARKAAAARWAIPGRTAPRDA